MWRCCAVFAAGVSSSAVSDLQRVHGSGADCCDLALLESIASPMLEASRLDHSICCHATQQQDCVNDHFGAFKDFTNYIGAHGQVFSDDQVVHFFSSMYTATPEDGVVEKWDLNWRAKFVEHPTAPQPQDPDPWVAAMLTPNLKFGVATPHNRSDDFAPGCPSGQRLYDDWTRQVFFQRFLPQLNESLPPQVKVNTTELYMSTVMSVLDEDGGEFQMKNATQLEVVRGVVQDVNWGEMIIHCYSAFPNVDGDIYSPAYNALFVAYDKRTHELSHYVIIAANAGGDAETKYIGVAFNEEYQSVAGYDYTPLTDSPSNPLFYRMEPFDPLNASETFIFHIRMWHVSHPFPSSSYIDVSTLVTQSNVTEITTAAVVNMVAKGYYMSYIEAAYYGDVDMPDIHKAGLKAISRTLAPDDNIESCQSSAAANFIKDVALFKRLKTALSGENPLPWIVEPACVASDLQGALV